MRGSLKVAILGVLVLAVSCEECADSVGPRHEEEGVDTSADAHAADSGGSDAHDVPPGCVTDECRCGRLPASECDTLPGCLPVEATCCTEDGLCDGREKVGCFFGDICDNNTYFATDTANRCWLFGGSCIPSTFDASAKTHEFCVQQFGPNCSGN